MGEPIDNPPKPKGHIKEWFNNNQLGYSEWDVPLDDRLTLREALAHHIHRVGKRDRLWAALEKKKDFEDRPHDTSFAIKIFENPSSPMKFPGAAWLFRHDCVHCLLGVGGRVHGEAFVVGFNAGASRMPEFEDKDKTDLRSYLYAAKNTYIDALKFTGNKQDVFRMAFEEARNGMRVEDKTSPYCGKLVRPRNLHNFDFENYLDTPMGELRRMLGINIQSLFQTYRWEGERLQAGNDTMFADADKRPAVPPAPPINSAEFKVVFEGYLAKGLEEIRSDKRNIPPEDRPHLIVGEKSTATTVALPACAKPKGAEHFTSI